MAKRKIEAFQDVKEKPLEVIPPVPPVGAEPVADKPVFKQTVTEKTPERVQPNTVMPTETPTGVVDKGVIPGQPPQSVVLTPPPPVENIAKNVFSKDLAGQQPEKLIANDTSRLETPAIPTFKSNIPQRSLEDYPSKLRGEVIQQTTEVRDNVFRGSVPTSPLERGR